MCASISNKKYFLDSRKEWWIFLPEILIVYLKIALQRIPYIYKKTQKFVISLSLSKSINRPTYMAYSRIICWIVYANYLLLNNIRMGLYWIKVNVQAAYFNSALVMLTKKNR